MAKADSAKSATADQPVAERSNSRVRRHKRFDVRYMSVGARYIYMGVAVIGIVLLCFFIGLLIDFMMQQQATVAIAGIVVGAILALIFCFRQLLLLTKPIDGAVVSPFDSPSDSATAKPKKTRRRDKLQQLSSQELKILTQSQQEVAQATKPNEPADTSPADQKDK